MTPRAFIVERSKDGRDEAVFSPNRRHRYFLRRTWGREPISTFVMLNPSTADAFKDDPTITRCIRFAQTFGSGGIHVVNLYALRSPNPKHLWGVDYADRVGEQNDHWLTYAFQWQKEYADLSGPLVPDAPLIAAWGAAAEQRRVEEVVKMPGFTCPVALGVTKSGQPRHPLYLRADSSLVPWRLP